LEEHCRRGTQGILRAAVSAMLEHAMFVIELIYKADLSEIDAHMSAHVAFLKKHYDAGTFLISGRKIPRDGGIILATGKTRAEIEALIDEDPFKKHDLADFRVIEFRASQRAKDIPKRIA
jgi:uncharacterized protein YciI